MTDTDTAAADHTSNVMVNPPKVDAPEPFISRRGTDGEAGVDGARQAADERIRQRRQSQPDEPPIRKLRVPDDGPEAFRDAKDAGKYLAHNKREEAKRRLWNTTSAAEADAAGRALSEDHPTVIEMTEDGKPLPKDRRITTKEAAEALANRRASGAPAVEQYASAERYKFEQLREVYGEELAAQLVGQSAEERAQTLGYSETPAETRVEQPVEQPQQQPAHDPIEEHRRQAQHELEAIRYLRGATQAETLLVAEAQKWHTAYLAEFSDVRNMDDVARLNPDQQRRWVQYQEVWKNINGQHQQALMARELTERRIGEVRQAQEAAANRAWVQEQQAIAAKSIPELAPDADPVRRVELTKAANEVLDAIGLTAEAEAKEHPAVRRAIRSAAFQQVVAKAARWDLARSARARCAHQISRQYRNALASRSRKGRGKSPKRHLWPTASIGLPQGRINSLGRPPAR